MSNISEAKKTLEEHRDAAYRLVISRREEYLKAWIAANGLHPNECMLVENRKNGWIESEVYALSRAQIEQTVLKLAKDRWMEKMETELSEAEAKIQAMREVLGFYADEKNWDMSGCAVDVAPDNNGDPVFYPDVGTRARKALEREKDGSA